MEYILRIPYDHSSHLKNKKSFLKHRNMRLNNNNVFDRKLYFLVLKNLTSADTHIN